MTREEFANIVKGLRSVYCNENFIKDKDAFNVWYELLKDLDYRQLSNGTLKFMQTNGRIPTPADLRKASIQADEMTEGEAWGIVLKAISRAYYYSKEEFEKLPETIRKAVGYHENLKEWAQSDMNSISVIQSQFLNSYRRALQSERENSLIAPNLRKMIAGCAEKLAIKGTEPDTAIDEFTRMMEGE